MCSCLAGAAGPQPCSSLSASLAAPVSNSSSERCLQPVNPSFAKNPFFNVPGSLARCPLVAQ